MKYSDKILVEVQMQVDCRAIASSMNVTKEEEQQVKDRTDGKITVAR